LLRFSLLVLLLLQERVQELDLGVNLKIFPLF